MPKPVVLQVGPYPAWDQEPLDQVFAIHRYFEAPDKAALLAQIGPQVRYQTLSSFKQKYPVIENLFTFGLKAGVTFNH